ncbi:SpoIIE family protein phosphatase [Streptomyces sparsogenes]|uniref:SpoIIE family protein phosphatase n=1 Tax=Streptomyces sparsogenes TaxID=67365 RepID=UPI0033F03E67
MSDRTAWGWPRDLPDPVTEATVLLTAEGALAGWSQGARTLLGYPAEEVLGRSADELLSPGDQGPGPFFASTSTERPSVVVLRHRDGSRVRVGLATQPWTGADGRPGRLVQMTRAEVWKRQEIGRALLNSLDVDATVAIGVYDSALRCMMQNAALRRLGGLTDEERLGRTIGETFPDLDAAQVEAVQRQVLETKEALLDKEVRGRVPADPRHEHVWADSIFPLRDRDDQAFAVCHAVIDITEQYCSRERLAIVCQASAEIGSTLDLEKTTEELVAVAVPRLADFACVDLLDSVLRGGEPPSAPITGKKAGALRRAAHKSVEPGCPEAVTEPGELDVRASRPASPFCRALTTGRAFRQSTSDPHQELEWLADDPARAAGTYTWGIHSWMVVPLMARGALLGVAVFLRKRRPDPFEQDDLLLAEEIVSRAAVCIDNARRYTRERSITLALQRSLLPRRLPNRSTLDLCSRYLPASSRAGVGGDWFDAIPLSGSRTALVVGDVVGHGMRAAVTMGRLRTAVRTLADLDLAPDELLTRLDAQIGRLAHDEPPEDAGGEVDTLCGPAVPDPGSPHAALDAWALGATCVYAVYDPISRRCVLSRAGHPPPAIIRPGEDVMFIESAGGPPLGVGGLSFESVEVELPADSLLALYTDGLVESRDHDITAGLDRLRRALLDYDGPLDTLCTEVIRTMLPDHPADDVALLVARTHPLGADRCASWDFPSDPRSVAPARHLVRERIAQWRLDHLTDTTTMLVGELLTNAILHGGSRIQVRLVKEDDSLICEVTDSSDIAPRPCHPGPTDEGGRGLFLVAQLAERWGTRSTGDGKTVWAEQSLAPTPEPRSPTGAQPSPGS